MKKAIFISFILICLENSFCAQARESLIAQEPKYTQGYLIFNPSQLQIDYYRVSITERMFDSNGFYKDSIVERNEIWDKNYLRINSQYFVETSEHEFLYTAEGWSKEHGKLEEIGPISLIGEGTSWLAGSTRICNGTTYAWAITQAVHPAGCCQFKYTLDNTGDFFSEPSALFPFGTAVPFYQHMYNTEFQNRFQYEDFRLYHGLSGLPQYFLQIFNEPGFPIVNPPNLSQGSYYYNSDGEILNPAIDDIVGVQKTMGPWRDLPPISTEVVFDDWTYLPIVGNDGLVDKFINNSNISDYYDEGLIEQQLTCVQTVPLSAGTNDTFDDASWSDNCFEDISTPGDTDGDGLPDMEVTINDWFECIQTNISGGIASIQAVNWNNGYQEEIINFSRESLYDAEGHYFSPNFTLPEGLASIIIHFENGKRSTLFIDLESKTQFSIPLSSLVSFNIFPVPIINSSYSVNVQSAATLDFAYSVLDSQGNSFFESKYHIRKNHNENHKIDLLNSLDGVWIHRFVFEDGSVKTITTTGN